MFKLTYFVFLLWWGYLADTCELAGMQLPHLPPSNWSVLPSHLIATFITTRALLFFIFLSWWKKWGKLIAECWSISNKYAIEVLPRLVCKRLGWHRYDIKWGGFFSWIEQKHMIHQVMWLIGGIEISDFGQLFVPWVGSQLRRWVVETNLIMVVDKCL